MSAPAQSTGTDPFREFIAGQDRERLLLLFAGEAHVLEMVAEDLPLCDSLGELVRVLEQQAEGMIGSLLLLSEDGLHLQHCAGPSLPESFSRAIDGEPIGPRAGSCGTAAFLRRQVVVSDIASDPLWNDYRDLALAAGLQACWSTPIFSKQGAVLGTFAIYYRTPTSPSPFHLGLIAVATHLARIAIERSLAGRERLCLLNTIRDAERKLRETDRRKSEFLAILSHELRNPLAPIRNSIHLLDRVPPGSPQAAHAREVIQRQTEHLARLVDDLLDVTRVTRGKAQLKREVLDLREVARRTRDDHLAAFVDRGVELRLEEPPRPVWASCDATRMAQVIGNLLANSAKFTERGGSTFLRVSEEGGRAMIRVRDNGAGMEPGELERVFEPFAQAPGGLTRLQDGLGLGLALVKGLVELHGGTVKAWSPGLGCGSEFTVALPLAAAPSEPAQAPSALAAPPRSVVVIEDNPDAASTLAEVLELAGHSVRTAADAASGMALVREIQPNVVLCDLGLPDLDGYQVARTLRADRALRATRLIALSGYAQPEDQQKAREAGFDAHLPKPPPLEELDRLLAGVAK